MSGIGEGMAALGSLFATQGASAVGTPMLLGAAEMSAGMPAAAVAEETITGMMAPRAAAFGASPSIAPGAVGRMIQNAALSPEMAQEVIAAAPYVTPSWGVSGTPSIAPGVGISPGLNLPVNVAGQLPAGIQPNPWAAAAGAGSDAYFKLRGLGIESAKVRKPSPGTVYMHPGQAVPVRLGQPLARKTSPIEAYVRFLRNL